MNSTEKFDFEIIEIAGRNVISKLLELIDELPDSGKYPFIIGERRSLEMIGEIYRTKSDSADEIIEKSLAINVENLFEELKKGSLPPEEETEFDMAELTGEFEEHPSPRDIGLYFEDFINTHTNLTTKIPFEVCLIGLAPTTESWELPAFARYGGWNDCPSPEKHCAVLRYWQEKYGAEIISMTGDVIECRVAKPPQTAAECFELAWEQYAYCSDIVNQGVVTVGALASTLRDSNYWYFWWD